MGGSSKSHIIIENSSHHDYLTRSLILFPPLPPLPAAEEVIDLGPGPFSFDHLLLCDYLHTGLAILAGLKLEKAVISKWEVAE